ncbi:MAG: glycosyltransferase [Planctomycetota bacterium]|nr:MAG: glycosyltransferase [Planctomycetota bacterium]
MPDHNHSPRLSVVIPTYGRGAKLANLLAKLDDQTLAPRDYEVIVVDDGSPEPVQIDRAALRYPCKLLRQPNQGPGAARNTAFEHVRAPLVLYLNDDAVPARDLLHKHVAIQARLQSPRAVLGSFEFTPESLRSPLTQVLSRTRYLFDYPMMQAGAEYGWPNLYTCNLSVPAELVRKVGGFDARNFPEAIMDDTEFGYRLEKLGVRVLYRPDAACGHDHELTPAAYLRRAIRLGVHQARFARVHGDPILLRAKPGDDLESTLLEPARNSVILFHQHAARAQAWLERFEAQHYGSKLDDASAKSCAEIVARLASAFSMRGWLLELAGVDPFAALEGEPGAGELTSLVVLSKDALPLTQRCIAALREAADPRHPHELIVVDNGSRDGSAEWLAAQSDVKLVRNATNQGACRARNQALQHARGACIAFLDNDAFVQPGWLSRLKRHMALDARNGLVGPLSDRAAHGQQITATLGASAPSDPHELARAIDAKLAREKSRLSRPATLMSSFCILVRRAVIDRIGGFDERFTPWGFEDDDFTLRARLAGFKARVAFDVFVRHEAYGGPKAEWHRELLLRNWRRFAGKWGLDPARHGDYGPLAALRGESVAPELLCAPFDGSQRLDPADLEPVRRGARAA